MSKNIILITGASSAIGQEVIKKFQSKKNILLATYNKNNFEIKKNYNKKIIKFKLDLSNESGLVGYWKFDEGSGTTVIDYSGNVNHGTFAAISGDTTAYPTWEKV